MALAASILLPVFFLAQEQDPLLLRMTEEAELFAQSASQLIAEETLTQRSAKQEKRSFFRVGQSALEPPKLVLQERELKSEFGYAQMVQDGDPVFHEARQVVSVDGKTEQPADKARRKLVSGLKSEGDEAKKNLLEDLQKHGLERSATDFSLMILLFRARNLPLLDILFGRLSNAGSEPALVYSFREKNGEGSFTIFNGKEMVHQKLRGEIWLRRSDGMPLRITFGAMLPLPNGAIVQDSGQVDYVRSDSGIVTPAASRYQRTDAAVLVSETLFRYSKFRKFSADSDLKFPESSGKP